MKIVLDTNVFIFGIFFSGPLSIILQVWKDSKIQIILSKEILEESEQLHSMYCRRNCPGLLQRNTL